jgi:hypothetical protein
LKLVAALALGAQFRYYPELGKKRHERDAFIVSKISEAILLRSMVNYRYPYFDPRLQIASP